MRLSVSKPDVSEGNCHCDELFLWFSLGRMLCGCAPHIAFWSKGVWHSVYTPVVGRHISCFRLTRSQDESRGPDPGRKSLG